MSRVNNDADNLDCYGGSGVQCSPVPVSKSAFPCAE
jgi:hypothetical protein